MLTIALKAEALRYASIFVTDHVVLPVSAARSVYPYAPTGQLPGGARQDYLDPLAMLGYLARATSRVRLGTSVLVIPYRHPLAVAKTLATIDVLSGGRLILGVGAGWLREEFEALGTPPFEERGAVTDEYLRVMRLAWTTDPLSFSGRYCRIEPVHALPKPAQDGGIPIWVGGHTPAALRRTATLGDGWHPIGLRPPATVTPDEYAASVATIHTLAAKAGRDPASITLSFRAPMEVRSSRAKPPAGDRPLVQGTAAEVLDDIRRYEALGVSHIVFDPVRQELRSVLDNMARFAEDVRPKLAGRRRARR